MLKVAAAALLFAGLAVGGCDNPKPRHVPPDPMAKAPAAAPAIAPPADGVTDGLAKRTEVAALSLERVG